MIILIAAGLIGLGALVWFALEEGFAGFIVGCAAVFIALLVGFGIAGVVGGVIYGDIPVKSTDRFPITAMTIRGNEFFLGFGMDGNNPVYTYQTYGGPDDRQIIIDTLDATEVDVYEDSTDGAYVEKFSADGEMRALAYQWDDPTRYEVHIPNGSLRYGFVAK